MSVKATYLSNVDRKLLKALLIPNGKISTKSLARKLGLPATTLQRRRKRLEKEFLKLSYTLDLARFGWHRVDFLINGKRQDRTNRIGTVKA